MEHLYFYIGLTFISVHEMDAIRCREWRIFPVLSLLTDKFGQLIFIFANIPLFFFVFYKLTHPESNSFIKWFDIFMIIHIGLHLLLLKNKNNEFKDWISWILIIGAGFFGLVDLII
jgi:hypothetical protein